MKAKFVYESLGDILKPKSKEDIVRDSEKLSKREKNNKLMWATAAGYKEIVQMLLDAGADINANAKDEDDWTALIYASVWGYEELVKILLDAGADVDIKDNTNRTSLMIVSSLIQPLLSHTNHKEIAQMLIDAEANINAKDNDGWTALMYALRRGHKEIAQMLLDAGANVNIKDKVDGWTPLMHASKNKELVEMLLDAGADVNIKNKNGETALMIAFKRGYEEIVDLLRKYNTK